MYINYYGFAEFRKIYTLLGNKLKYNRLHYFTLQKRRYVDVFNITTYFCNAKVVESLALLGNKGEIKKKHLIWIENDQ